LAKGVLATVFVALSLTLSVRRLRRQQHGH